MSGPTDEFDAPEGAADQFDWSAALAAADAAEGAVDEVAGAQDELVEFAADGSTSAHADADWPRWWSPTCTSPDAAWDTSPRPGICA